MDGTSPHAQGMFALARLGELAPQHPEWKETMPFKAVLAGDHNAMSTFTEADWMQIVAVTHAGMSTEAFQSLVKNWLAKTKAPRFDRPYTDLVYQPMLEVMRYLREKGFRTYIVTGGGQEFVRVYSEQVVGSSIAHDAKHEYAYGPAGRLPHTHVGTFSNALMSQAKRSGWIVISMKHDWNRIFPFDK